MSDRLYRPNRRPDFDTPAIKP